jgi:hypothetical protein
MLKHLLSAALMVSLLQVASAQNANGYYQPNPFRELQFTKGPTDTLTITASYAGEYGKLSDNDVNLIKSVDKVHRLNIRKFDYAVGFKINGYPQTFYIPCKDKEIGAQLADKQNAGKLLKLTCTVCRFFYIDGICNFFYIDKAELVKHGI